MADQWQIRVHSNKTKYNYASVNCNEAIRCHLTSLEHSKFWRGLNWRHQPGRSRHTWLCALEADLQPLNLGLNSAHREPWKHLVETATLRLGACS